MSKCLSGVVMYQYPQDQERYAVKQYNKKLKEFESKKYPEKTEFFELKGYNDYCTRRFSDVEERTNCRVMTNSIREDFFLTDFCTHRLFSANDEYFDYNLIYKWTCLRDRLGTKQKIKSDIVKIHLEICGVGSNQYPLIYQQRCLQETEMKEMYATKPYVGICPVIILNKTLTDDIYEL